jgi:predicted metalloprotease with PDZ domain
VTFHRYKSLTAAFLLCLWIAPASASPRFVEPVVYSISLAHPEKHLVHVRIELAPGSNGHEMQLPVWNALYQVRDFSQYVNWVKATTRDGHPLPVRSLDKSRWEIDGTEFGAIVEYEIYVDQPGPFSAQLNEHHAFFNLAQILMYPVDARYQFDTNGVKAHLAGERESPMQVNFVDLPTGWKIATALTPMSSSFTAENYDQLVDSPVEIGSFQEAAFDQGGARYRVAIDADAGDYNMDKTVAMLQRIAASATAWMNDRPFESYLFIYHFPHGPGGGGMEHAYSTAISVSAQTLTDRPDALPDVTAHEFFHLWNVKRIRPQSLEPIDYTKEQYTRALWFSEGCTSTAGSFIELRAGLMDEKRFLRRLAEQIEEFEQSPAHLAQSAEDSSLDAWLEKYPYYRRPERSVSYYNKGFLLGIALDLQLREFTQDKASLREVFQQMNDTFAKHGLFFPDSDGVRQAAEAVSRVDLTSFFEKYVRGTDEIPWDDFFKTVGLRLFRHTTSVVDPGFSVSRNFDGPQTVSAVRDESDAQRAGVKVGDELVAINGKVGSGNLQTILQLMKPGETLQLRLRSGRTERNVSWKLGSKEEVEFELKDVDNITPQQKTRRAAWLRGEAEGESRQ